MYQCSINACVAPHARNCTIGFVLLLHSFYFVGSQNLFQLCTVRQNQNQNRRISTNNSDLNDLIFVRTSFLISFVAQNNEIFSPRATNICIAMGNGTSAGCDFISRSVKNDVRLSLYHLHKTITSIEMLVGMRLKSRDTQRSTYTAQKVEKL